MTINIDEDNLKSGLLGLIVALVEIIQETLERQAIKRMESGRLNEDEIERLGNALMELSHALEHIRTENDIEDAVSSMRNGLDSLANEVINNMVNPECRDVRAQGRERDTTLMINKINGEGRL